MKAHNITQVLGDMILRIETKFNYGAILTSFEMSWRLTSAFKAFKRR